MIHLTYIQNSGGRSGHSLGDIFSAFAFVELLGGGRVIYNSSWFNRQFIISDEALKKYTTSKLDKYDYILVIDKYNCWEGISFKQFCDIKNTILEFSKKYDKLLVQLTNVCRINLDVVYKWYKLNFLKNDLYSNNIIPKLSTIYFSDHDSKIIPNTIGIHIRRGDLSKRLINSGFTYDYYKNIIDKLNTQFDYEINIYCENLNCNDILKLGELNNTLVHTGGTNKIYEDFSNLCRSEILLLSPSSFSLFTGYLSKGVVLVDKKCAKFRPNLFSYVYDLPNFISFEEKITDKVINKINIYLKKK